jgi:hypothetical protein
LQVLLGLVEMPSVCVVGDACWAAFGEVGAGAGAELEAMQPIDESASRRKG